QKFQAPQRAPHTSPASSVRQRAPASPASRSRGKLRRAQRRFHGSSRNTKLPQVSGKNTSGQTRGRAKKARPAAITTRSFPRDQRNGRTPKVRGQPRFSNSSSVSRIPGSTLAKAAVPAAQ